MVLRGLLVALALAAPAAAASPTPWTGFNDISGVAGAVPFDTAAATAARAGATSTRVIVDWSWIEPAPGHYAWGVVDAFYRANLAHGMRPLLGVTGAPRWAWDASARCRAGTQCAFPPGRAHEDAYAAMLAQLTRRYPRAVAIEIGNEPNLAWAWAGGVSPARYTRLLKRAYTAVKSADPGMPVIAGGLAPVLSDVRTPGQVGLRPFLQGMYDHGARGYMDGISVHPYPDGTDLAKSFAAVRLVKEVRDANGDDVPLWATEFGLTTTRTSPTDQAQTIAALYRALRADPEIRGLYVHTLYDDPSNPIEAERGYGLVGRDQTPKPAYCELAAAMGASSGCEAIGSVPPTAAQTARWDAQVLLQAAADAARRVHVATGSYAAVTPAALHTQDARLSTDQAPLRLLPGPLADPAQIALFPLGRDGLVLCNASTVGRSYCIASTWQQKWGYGSTAGTIFATARATINAQTSGW